MLAGACDMIVGRGEIRVLLIHGQRIAQGMGPLFPQRAIPGLSAGIIHGGKMQTVPAVFLQPGIAPQKRACEGVHGIIAHIGHPAVRIGAAVPAVGQSAVLTDSGFYMLFVGIGAGTLRVVGPGAVAVDRESGIS